MLKYLEEIEEQIRSERCVIMLGPNAVRTPDGKALKDHLWDSIKSDKKSDISLEFDADSLLKFHKHRQRVSYNTYLKKVYIDEQTPDRMHRQLARIPCHLLISTTADMRFRQAFEEQGIDYQYQFYNKKLPSSTRPLPPTKENPLLFNLFGSIQDPDSLIFTHSDLFDFLFSILGDNKLPPELLQSVKQAEFFLFLGFDFDKWYLRLLLRLFGLHENSAALASGYSERTHEPIQRFYEDNFELIFVHDSMDEYVNALYEKFRSKGQLRQADEHKSNPLVQKIRVLIREDELDEAIDVLDEYGESQADYELTDTATQLMGRLKSLKRNIRNGTIDEKAAERERNQIRHAVLEVAGEER